jgi:hypothetical protein
MASATNGAVDELYRLMWQDRGERMVLPDNLTPRERMRALRLQKDK